LRHFDNHVTAMGFMRRDLLDALNDVRPEDVPASVAAEEHHQPTPRRMCQRAGLPLHPESSYATVGAAKRRRTATNSVLR